jgi:hypothetical protein
MGYVMGICRLHVRSVKGTEKDEQKRKLKMQIFLNDNIDIYFHLSIATTPIFYYHFA